jgi:hypothetical protein
MNDKLIDQKAPEPLKRFTSSEQFRKEYYPKSEEQEARQKIESEGDFGSELAFESLTKHAAILQFRNA